MPNNAWRENGWIDVLFQRKIYDVIIRNVMFIVLTSPETKVAYRGMGLIAGLHPISRASRTITTKSCSQK